MEYNKPDIRPRSLPNRTYRFDMVCGKKLYITVTYNPDEDNRLFEVFIKIGKSMNGEGTEETVPGETVYCHLSVIEALGRTISNYLRAKCDPSELVNTYRGIRCAYSSPNPNIPNSCPDAISMVINKELSGSNICNKCGEPSDTVIKYYTRIGKLPYYICEDCKQYLVDDQNLITESEFIELEQEVEGVE